MKVLIISHSDLAGGANIAAYRLHCGLRLNGIESTMLVRHKLSNDANVFAYDLADPDEAWQKSLHKHLAEKARPDANNGYFSLPWPGADLASHSLVQEADVINLHWVAHFVSPESLRDLLALGTPVVWTLHDMRAFTGGCHYTAGCEGFVQSCEACPQLLSEFHRLPELALGLSCDALSEMPKPVIVAPSQWLSNEAARSRVFAGCRVEVIPYGLDLTEFEPRDRRAARERFGIEQDALVLTFGGTYLTEHRKGFDLLRAAITQAIREPDIAARVNDGSLVFAAFGRSDKAIKKSGLPIITLGEQRSAQDMATVFSASDLFICPTREDNLPCSIMEAMACGIATLATNVGGVPDLITDRVHGRLVPAENSLLLGQAMVELIRDPSPLAEWGHTARGKCELRYGLSKQGASYEALFQSLCPVEAIAKPMREEDAAALRIELARAQGRQVEWLLQQNLELKTEAKELRQRTPPEEMPTAAARLIDSEFQQRKQSSAFWFLSPLTQALRIARKYVGRPRG